MSEPKVTETKLFFRLPFALPIPDDEYLINYNSIEYWITTERRKSTYTEVWDGKVEDFSSIGEMKFDRRGCFTFTAIEMVVPGKVDTNEKGTIYQYADFNQLKFKELIAKIVNRFIEVVRFYSKEYYIEPISSWDILFYHLQEKRAGKWVPHIWSSEWGPFGMGRPDPIPDENIKKIKTSLENGTLLDDAEIHLLNAKKGIFIEDFKYAIIESIISLEIVLSSFIKNRCDSLGIDKNSVKDFLIRVGLEKSLEVVLRLVLKENEIVENILISKCKGVNTLRNKIIHEGYSPLNGSEIEEHVLNIEKLVNCLRGFIL